MKYIVHTGQHPLEYLLMKFTDVIIIKTLFHLPQALVSLAEFSHPGLFSPNTYK
jgi:hypothetical protein